MLTITAALLQAYHHTQTYLHEVAIRYDHLIKDLTPSYQLEKVTPFEPNVHALSSYIKPVSVITPSVHSSLDIMLRREVDTYGTTPIFKSVRMANATLVLTKLYISFKKPESQIESLLGSGIPNLGPYLDWAVQVSTNYPDFGIGFPPGI